MPDADFFKRLGLFVSQGYFEPEFCELLRSEMRSSELVQARVYQADWGQEPLLNLDRRKSQLADVPLETVSLVEARLLKIKPAVEDHFKINLISCKDTQFLLYKEGDFYGPHQDTRSVAAGVEFNEDRRVAIIVFLNSASGGHDPESYDGGDLTFYGLMDDPALKKFGLPLVGEEGLLIAFLPSIVHEVTPVTRGERFTIGSWFH